MRPWRRTGTARGDLGDQSDSIIVATKDVPADPASHPVRTRLLSTLRWRWVAPTVGGGAKAAATTLWSRAGTGRQGMMHPFRGWHEGNRPRPVRLGRCPE